MAMWYVAVYCAHTVVCIFATCLWWYVNVMVCGVWMCSVAELWVLWHSYVVCGSGVLWNIAGMLPWHGLSDCLTWYFYLTLHCCVCGVGECCCGVQLCPGSGCTVLYSCTVLDHIQLYCVLYCQTHLLSADNIVQIIWNQQLVSFFSIANSSYRIPCSTSQEPVAQFEQYSLNLDFLGLSCTMLKLS